MKKTTFLIAGKHAVTEALKNPSRKVLRVFLTEDSKKTINKDNKDLNLLSNIKLFYKTKKELDRLCSKDQISHQGLIAEVEHLEKKALKSYLTSVKDEKKALIRNIVSYFDKENFNVIYREYKFVYSSFFIDLDIVFQLVNIPPSHL